MNELEKIRVCKYSKEDFIAKRTNQVFKNEECRKNFHNENNGKLRSKLNKINKFLFNNYKSSIKALDGKLDANINLNYLINYKYFTHLEKIAEETFYGLYDVAFIKINSNEYRLIRTKI